MLGMSEEVMVTRKI